MAENSKFNWKRPILYTIIIVLLIGCGITISVILDYSTTKLINIARYESVDPQIWYDMNEYSVSVKLYTVNEGEILLDGKKMQITVDYRYYGNTAYVVTIKEKGTDKVLLSGTYTYTDDVYVITVDTDSDSVFDGKYETITFRRTETYD